MNPLRDEPLALHTTFKIGGGARYFFSVTSLDELLAAIRFSKKESLPFFILGGGSNTLFSDNGFAGVVGVSKLV
jgi:UDP-N-acetylmuramate dehydrogenase